MHAIAFGLKRAFHATLAITRRPLATFGITAARLDMLHAIQSGGDLGLPQRSLRALLGVTDATISRMLRALEELEYITRSRDPHDARRLVVRLTRTGLSILRRAFATVARTLDFAYDIALTDGRPWDESACLLAMDCAESHARRIRACFEDEARLSYPWHPDD